MKWPKILRLIRHGNSEGNRLKHEMENDYLWPEFVEAYEKNYRSPQTRRLAKILNDKYYRTFSDYETPLSDLGWEQAIKTGSYLKQNAVNLPDTIFISPFMRCRQTFEGVAKSWPELKKIPQYIDGRIREREVGLRALYSHWRIFNVFHPDEKEYYDSLGPTAYYHCRYSHGESVDDVMERMRNGWLETLIREFSACEAWAFGHGVSIMSTRAIIERMSPEEFLQLEKSDPPKNCSITTYRCDPKLGLNGKLILERYNETAP